MPSRPTARVLDFQRRALRALDAGPAMTRAAYDELITDGCAEALAIEGELIRLVRRRPGRRDAQRVAELRDLLAHVQDTIAVLMRRRVDLVAAA